MNEQCCFQAHSPEFDIMGDKIRVLFTPEEFFLTLKNLLSTAKRRIIISSLYLGAGNLEKQLVDSIEEALNKSNGDLKVQILLDYTRGSRGQINSRTMLLPLMQRKNDVKVALYHTPSLRGIKKQVLPDRWNEVIGLQHMKIYIADDTVLMSGANLSHDYFTNRQDRYIILHDANLSDFFHSLVATVSKFSLQLNADNTESLHNDWKIHPFKGDYVEFKNEVKRSIEELLSIWKLNDVSFETPSASTKRLLHGLGINSLRSKSSNADSKVYPLIQMGLFNVRNDEKATDSFFRMAAPQSLIRLATGYFNLTALYSQTIANECECSFEILTASPKANGFLGGKGISGSIPMLYLYLAKTYLKKLKASGRQNSVAINEYERDKWTFHGKGLWYYPPLSTLPTITLIGSPNFGYRSVYRDLEAQLAIVTSNVSLMKQLHQEQIKFYQHSHKITDVILKAPDRHIPIWVRLFTKVFRNYF